MAKRSKESIAKYKATMAAKRALQASQGAGDEIPLHAIQAGVKKPKGKKLGKPLGDSKREEIALELARLFNRLLS